MSAHDLFEKHADEFLKFDRVENKRSSRADLNAFLLLNELFPCTEDIVSSAEHDQIWLNVEGDEIERLTEEQIIELQRSGIMYDNDVDSLSMFV